MRRLLLLGALALAAPPALAAGKAADQKVSILPGGDAKSPISIEADRLDYFEKEGKAVYDGHVVVVQQALWSNVSVEAMEKTRRWCGCGRPQTAAAALSGGEL